MREFFQKIEKGGKPNTSSCNIDVIYNNFKQEIEKLNIVKDIIVSEISPTIASHVGPDAIGLAYKLKKPKQIDLK